MGVRGRRMGPRVPNLDIPRVQALRRRHGDLELKVDYEALSPTSQLSSDPPSSVDGELLEPMPCSLPFNHISEQQLDLAVERMLGPPLQSRPQDVWNPMQPGRLLAWA